MNTELLKPMNILIIAAISIAAVMIAKPIIGAVKGGE